MSEPTLDQDTVQAQEVVAITIAEYDRMAAVYRRGTADHDVSQNIAALLKAIEGEAPYVILDLGCGPGRDLRQFTALGHEAVGLDGSAELSAMARANTDCEVLHQDFLALDLPSAGEGIARGIYVTATGRRVVVLHVFVKKSRRTPRRALQTARERMRQVTL